MTSRRTQESISVTGRIGTISLATQQRHNLVSAQADHFPGRSSVAQPPNQPPAPALRAFGAHYLQRATYLYDLNLITRVQSELGP
jgi:hypothetical protein